MSYSSGTYRETYVFEGQFSDRISAPVDQASARIDHLGASAQDAAAAIKGATEAISAGFDRANAAAGRASAGGLGRLQQQFDPLGAKLQQAENALGRLNARIQSGGADVERYGALMPAATAKVEDLRSKHNQFLESLNKTEGISRSASNGLRGMSIQFIDVAQQMATGQRPLQVFLQQGGQIAQIAAVSGVGLKDLGAAITGFLTPMRLAVGGVAAFVAAMAGLVIYAESTERRVSSLRLAFSGARDDYAKMADVFEAASHKSSATLTSTAQDIAKARQIIITQGRFQGTADDLVKVTEQAEALGKVMGTDLPTAMNLYATAVRDPLAAIKQIAGTPELLNQVSVATLGLAKAEAESGNRARATQLILNDLNRAREQQRAGLTDLQRETEDTDKAFSRIVDNIRQAGLAVGEFLKGAVVDAVKGIKEFIDLIKQIPSLLPVGLAPSSGSGPGPRLSSAGLPGPVIEQLNRASAPTGEYGQQLYQALINVESQGNQFDKYGRVNTSSAGALGIGQVMPFNAAGYDLTTQEGNIAASSKLFIHLFQKYQGDPTLVVAAYNWGEGAVDRFLKNGGQMPAETQGEVSKVLKLLDQSGVQRPTGASGAVGSSGTDLGRGQFGPEDNEAARRALSGDFGAGTAKQIAEVSQQLKDATALFEQYQQVLPANSKLTQEYAARVANLREQLLNLQDPTRQDIRASLQKADVTRLLGEADQKLLEQERQYRNYNEEHRNTQISDEQITRALLATRRELAAQFDRDQSLIERDTSLKQKQVDAWNESRKAVSDADLANQAYIETQKGFSESDAQFTERVQQRTKALQDNKRVTDTLALQPLMQQARDDISVLTLEISTLGQDNNSRQVMIDLLRTEQQLRAQYPGLSQEAIDGYLAEKKAVDELNNTLRGRQADLDEVANSFSSAFNTIGSAITQAFVDGNASAVNFGNVMKSVAAQVVQEFLKLSVLNPILNGLFGQNNPTIFSVANTIGSQGGFFSQGIFGTSNYEAINQLSTPSQLISEGGGLDSPLVNGAGTGILGGASIGGLALGTLGGFALGSVAGGITQRAANKTGPAPMIGAGAGALAGAAIGSIIPGIGTVIGGLIGGIVGGAGGGFIGPRPPSPYAATYVGIGPNGQLTVNPALQGNQITASNYADIQNQVNAFNQQTSQLGVRVIGTGAAPKAGAAGGLGFFGTANNLAGIQGANIADSFSNIRFGAAGDVPAQSADVLNRYINAKAFSTFDQLGQAVNKVRGFVEQTVPALLKMGSAAGSLQDALDNINQQFAPAIATAKELGYAEDQLTQARDKAVQKAYNAAAAQFAQLPATYTSRLLNAQASLSGDPQQALQAQIYAFDMQANAERQDLHNKLVDTYGEGVTQWQLYADLTTQLEKTLGQERLAIQKSSNEDILQNAKQNATQLVTSITDYVHNLQGGSLSPLSPQAQLDMAQRQFGAVFGSAAAGNAESIGKITQYADTYLNAARQVYGSGAGYVATFQNVVDALQKVSEVSPDTLTASIYASETRAQTATLVDSLTSLQNEVAALRAQVATGSVMPTRIAA